MMLQTLKGYKVVYNIKGYDITAGNSQIFPKRHIAEIYKRNHDQNSVKRMAKRSRVGKLLERVEIELENKNPEEKQTL